MSSLDAPATPDTTTAMRYDANKKSAGVAYLLWFFLGWFGGHRFYAGRIGSAIAILLLSIFSLLLSVVGIGLAGIAIVAVWCLVDAFLIPGMVRSHNNKLIDGLTASRAAA
jgi:TM2 domain-containing membrane protein YozV